MDKSNTVLQVIFCHSLFYLEIGLSSDSMLFYRQVLEGGMDGWEREAEKYEI